MDLDKEFAELASVLADLESKSQTNRAITKSTKSRSEHLEIDDLEKMISEENESLSLNSTSPIAMASSTKTAVLPVIDLDLEDTPAYNNLSRTSSKISLGGTNSSLGSQLSPSSSIYASSSNDSQSSLHTRSVTSPSVVATSSIPTAIVPAQSSSASVISDATGSPVLSIETRSNSAPQIGTSNSNGSATKQTEQKFELPSKAAQVLQKDKLTNATLYIKTSNHSEGCLLKFEEKKKKWKVRYFVLQDAVLTCYKKKGGGKIGEAQLFSVFVKDFDDEYKCFEINTSEVSWLLCTATRKEKDQWKEQIANQKKARREKRVQNMTMRTEKKTVDIDEYKRQQRLKYEKEQREIEERNRIQQKIKEASIPSMPSQTLPASTLPPVGTIRQTSIQGTIRNNIPDNSGSVQEQIRIQQTRLDKILAQLEDAQRKKLWAVEREDFAKAAEFKREIEALQGQHDLCEELLLSLQRELERIQNSQLQKYQERLAQLNQLKNEAVSREDYVTAARIKEEIQKIESQIY